MRAIDIRMQVVDAEAADRDVGRLSSKCEAEICVTLLQAVSSLGVMSFQFFAAVARDPDQAVIGAGPQRVHVLEDGASA